MKCSCLHKTNEYSKGWVGGWWIFFLKQIWEALFTLFWKHTLYHRIIKALICSAINNCTIIYPIQYYQKHLTPETHLLISWGLVFYKIPFGKHCGGDNLVEINECQKLSGSQIWLWFVVIKCCCHWVKSAFETTGICPLENQNYFCAGHCFSYYALLLWGRTLSQPPCSISYAFTVLAPNAPSPGSTLWGGIFRIRGKWLFLFYFLISKQSMLVMKHHEITSKKEQNPIPK